MRVWKYGDDVNTDMLFPGKYTYTCSTPEEIRPHLLEDLDPEFTSQVSEGDIIIAGKNFGCGSSREQPALGLKSVGIQAIVAVSFARIFYRNAINIGLCLLEGDTRGTQAGDEIRLDMGNFVAKNISQGREIKIHPLPPFMNAILTDGGLVQHFKKWGGFKLK